MLVSTTCFIEGYEVREYLGMICAETVLSGNVFHDFFAGIVNFLGGRARGYEKEMQKARLDALKKLIERAQAIQANAILGVRIDYTWLPVVRRGGMLMVSAQGTAVVLVRLPSAPSPLPGTDQEPIFKLGG